MKGQHAPLWSRHTAMAERNILLNRILFEHGLLPVKVHCRYITRITFHHRRRGYCLVNQLRTNWKSTSLICYPLVRPREGQLALLSTCVGATPH
jgi:hypothetical protein